MAFFDQHQMEWFSRQMRSLLIYINNIELSNKEKETMAEYLQKIFEGLNQNERIEVHEGNDQLYSDCLFNGSEYKQKPVPTTRLRLKNDKKMRQLVETLRMVFRHEN